MIVVLTVLEIVAPVFLLAAIGYTWVRLGIEYRIRFVTQLAMTLATPALVFTALVNAEIDPGALADLLFATLAAYAVFTLAVAVLVWLGRLNARTFFAPLLYGNTGNLGLPLALFAFGEAGLGYAVVVFSIMGIYSFTFGVWLVSGGGSPAKVLKEPLVGATVLGGIFLWQGWELPRFAMNTLELIAQMAIPLMLITLGVAVARLKPGNLGLALLLSLIKLAGGAAIGAGVGLAFGLEPVAFGVLVMQLATPVAVTNYLLAEKYGADADAVAGLVVVSTLLSVGTIPLTLAFLV